MDANTESTNQPNTPVEPAPADVSQELYNKIRDSIDLEYQQRFLIWKKQELSDIEAKMDDKVRDLVAEFWEKWKEEQKPPTAEEIQKLLSQEYVEFPIKIIGRDKKERTFVLRELPQKVERKFYREFKERLKNYGPQIAAFAQANIGSTVEQQLFHVLDSIDGAFDIIADGVAICLDPFGEDPDMTTEWVQDNISIKRSWDILEAQSQVNRLRDFFSQLYQAGQKTETAVQPISFRGLLERVR